MIRYRERQSVARESSIRIRVTPQELEYLRRAAADHGMTVSAYMIYAALPNGYYPEPKTKSGGEATDRSSTA